VELYRPHHLNQEGTEMKTFATGLAASLFAVFLAAQPAVAQQYLMPETPNRGIWMEASHPNVKGELAVTLPSTAWFLSGRHPVMDRLWGVVDVPFAYGKLDVPNASDDGATVLGNPYLGVEYTAMDRVTLEAGARLPLTTADENSFGDVVGFLADPLRGEAFMMDVFPLSAAVNVRHSFAAGTDLRVRGGVVSALYTGDEDEGETMTFLDYGFFTTYPLGLVRVGGGVSGRWDATADEGDFSDNSLHQLGLSSDLLFRGMRPGISLRVPLDESHRELVGSTVGLYLQVPLR
jgi:hypothetical protein